MRMLANGDTELLIALHAGVFESPLWRDFLERLRARAGVASACLVLRPARDAPLVQLAAGAPVPPQFQRIFGDHQAVNSLPHRAMREGRVYPLDEIIDPADPARRAFHADVLVPGGARYLRSVRVSEPGGVDAWLSIIDTHDLPASASALLSRLVPHLGVALRSHVALERERLRSTIASEAMGRLNFGWMTLDAHCRILDATPNIAAILQRTSLLRRDRYDRLTFASAALEREVAALVRDFAVRTGAGSRAINLSQDPWMDMLVTPLPANAGSSGSTAAALVYLNGDRWSRSNRCEQLVELFGLLPSEARLAWAIAQGRSIAEAAVELGLTLETARNYSKKIYSKTGASGQAALVRIIFTSVLAIA